MKWAYGFSESLARYYIVDIDGFLIINAMLSLETASRVVRLHNQEVDRADERAEVAAGPEPVRCPLCGAEHTE